MMSAKSASRPSASDEPWVTYAASAMTSEAVAMAS